MWQFKLDSIEDIKTVAESLDTNIDAIDDVSILARPVDTGDLTIPNSLAVHPMEGCDGDYQGRPEKLTIRRYERFAAGGAGLLWAEAIAVAPEGRANPRQLWLNDDSADRFATMIRRTRHAAKTVSPDHNPVIVAQLTHSGRYSKPHGLAHPLIPQRDPYRDPLTPQQTPDAKAPSKLPDDWPVITDEYLDNLQDAYVNAAKIAFEVGFDAVDIKSCHGYLINELLASRNREGKYGGSFENRTRFLLEVIDKIHSELGPDKPVFTRLGIYDAIPYPYGWAVDKDDYKKPDLTEPKKLIALLQERGVNVINVTIANPYYNPHVGRPFNNAITGGYDSPEHPVAGIARLIDLAGQIQTEFPDLAVIGTGYSWLRTLMPNVAAATIQNRKATLVGAGRLAFAYPDFAKDIIEKQALDPAKVCVGCSACTQIMRDGGRSGCVVRDNKIYGPIFKKGRMSSRENLTRLAANCLQCQEPTCQLACPAGVNIPKFISLFLEGEDRKAYEVIKESNVLPEICAWLCPVEHQCQGGCLQHYIGDEALPIAEIQRHLAEIANKEGWSRLKAPEASTGKRIAVIGAGPAGLSAAAMLIEKGHAVTIFDKSDTLGGIVASVIPPDRQGQSLPNEIEAIFKDLPADRLTKKLSTSLTPDMNLDSILAESFDAAFIGAGLADSITTCGKQLDGLYTASQFLAQAKSGAIVDLNDKTVAVTGGGNTAMDAAVTAKKLGAKDVYIIYRRSFEQMPAWAAERDRALNEGVHFLLLTHILQINAPYNKIDSLTLCPTKLGEPDKSNRRKPVPIELNPYFLDTDIIVEAIGQKAENNLESILPGVQIEYGLVKTAEDSFQTSKPGVFAGGDIVHGASTVVSAVADGMKAAKEIDAFLTQ